MSRRQALYSPETKGLKSTVQNAVAGIKNSRGGHTASGEADFENLDKSHQAPTITATFLYCFFVTVFYFFSFCHSDSWDKMELATQCNAVEETLQQNGHAIVKGAELGETAKGAEDRF